MALDVSGLAALVARGKRARCKGMVGGLVRVGPDCAHRVATAAPASTRTPSNPPGPAPASSTALGRWSGVPRLETGGERGGMRFPAPVGVRRGPVRRSPAPTRLVGGAVPRGGGGGLLACRHGLVGVLPAQSALVLEFLQGPFL